MKYEIDISDGLYHALHDYTYEIEIEMNDFVIDAIIEKINNENEIFNSDVGVDGWENGETSTKNFIN